MALGKTGLAKVTTTFVGPSEPGANNRKNLMSGGLLAALLIIILSWLPPLIAEAGATFTLNFENDVYQCQHAATLRTEDAESGLYVSKESWCKSSSGKTATYRQEKNQGSLYIIGNNGKAEVKHLGSAQGAFGKKDAEESVAAAFSSILGHAQQGHYTITDSDVYKEMISFSKRHVELFRKKAIKEDLRPQHIIVDFPDRSEIKCTKEPTNIDYVSGFDPKQLCQIYSCQDGQTTFMINYSGSNDPLPGFVDSLDNGKLGASFTAKKIATSDGKVIFENKFISPPLSPEVVATVQSQKYQKALRRMSYAACDGPTVKKFLKQHDRTAQEIAKKIAETDVIEKMDDSFGIMTKAFKSDYTCRPEGTKVSAAPPLSIPSDKKIMSPEQAKDLFAKFKNREDLPPFVPNGCEARAHIISTELDNNGYFTEKIFLQSALMSPDYEGPLVEWPGHVAPIVAVTQPDGRIERMVFDTALFDEPVPVEKWLNRIKLKDGHKTVWTDYPPPALGNRSLTQRATISIASWKNYWPGEDSANQEALLEKAKNTVAVTKMKYDRARKSYQDNDF